MVAMTSCGYFLNKQFANFRVKCEKLTSSMIKYADFLKQQVQRSAANRQLNEPVRSLDDSNVMRDVQVCSDGELSEQYTKVYESIKLLKDFEPLFLHDFEPEDAYDKKKWLAALQLPFQTKLYSHKYGNYIGNYTFIWKSPADPVGDLQAVTAIKHDLLKFSTRGMRKSFFLKYSKCGPKPAVLRHMYRFLTEDDTAAESRRQEEVNNRVTEFLLNSDSTELLYDLRKNNGRPKDTRLDPFWDLMSSHLDNIGVVDERRHGDKLYMPVAISVENLIETVAKDLPKDASIPSKSWVQFNFWPSNAYTRSAMCYTGRFNVKFAVQQRIIRAKHPDANFAFHQYTMMKEMASNLRDESVFICLDDKSVVPIGEPGKPVSTGVRAHNKSLVPVAAKLASLDHDFHVHGAVPSVLFKVHIPEDSKDSYYNGQIHVVVKDKVFSPSSAARHTTETVKILRETESDDGVSLNKPRLFVYTDGGPDHRTTYWSVQLAYIAMFVSLDIDMLIAVRTAPCQSYNNPAERCMSLLNLALQNVALERSPMTDVLEYRTKSLTSLKKLRNAAERTEELKQSLIESLNPVLALLKQRFSQLKKNHENVVAHDAASDGEIEQMMECLEIFNDHDAEESSPVTACKDLDKAPPRLKAFFNAHCRKRNYTFQIKKCDDEHCWYCVLSPRRADTSELVWLPDPTKGDDDSFLPLSECIGKNTTDEARPSLDGKVLATEADKRHKSHMSAAQARRYILCADCRKRRVVYSRTKLTVDQCRQLELLDDAVIYTCGSAIFPEEHDLHEQVFVREGLSCQTEIETTYYSAVTQNFPPICYHCGDTNILGEEVEPITALRQQYSIVRPICRGCLESGKMPATRNAHKMNRKRKL
ncbi:uncharacterized protein LOC127858198 isoform X2 [Dreissena polymorpha]|nr:uncharacterized protein LOC127857563 isoform X11 [Dreissena polymorpha]XP_052249976.1 uncharacterized protein LOC127857563 isoform X11 [Dreissena polymorpha]XP_052249977.1 uncharacterized protein LOC127857563 isoform X12 [Dreissena polymorpha]XP_052249978.1 uncharacterized protein LOC127857563 isoform X12 [Dreissena polymorpha]XP_052251132.1 uncharacterized protein LOC127858198 isoform X2 [Dreissena polymorpha]XP_052251133.1 uncharacterized protein LOC127858198 isoform X2 [Dreissena polymor